MKKSVLGLVVALLCMSGNVMAQSNEREALIDSIVDVSLNQAGRMKMIQGAKECTDETDPITAEATIYIMSQEMLRQILVKSYGGLTDEQLKSVVRYMGSEANRRISSNEVSEGLTLYLLPDMMGCLLSAVSGTSWKSEVPSLHDKEYGALVDRYIELTGALSVFDKVMDPLMAKIKQEMGASSARMMTSMMTRIQKNYPAYYKAALVSYVSKEHLQEAIDFYSQPYMLEVQQSAMNLGASLMDGGIKDMEAFAEQMMKFLDGKGKIEDTSSVVMDYIARLPYMPVCNKVDSIFPVRTLAVKKKATYTGQTRDGLAHGKGVLTDKKGIRYSGDFRKGKRHGLITTYSLSGDSARHVWADDKVLAAYNTDLLKPAATYKGKAMGYGYKTTLTGREEGYFIDGELCGQGKATSGEIVKEGRFVGGSLVEGRIIDKSTTDKIVQFEGELFNDGLMYEIRKGSTKIVTKKDGKKTAAIKTGTFVNREMHGMGSWEYGEDGYSWCEEGYFAYDELYGKGHRTRKWDKDNTTEVYDGDFFAGKYQGQGVKKRTFTDKNLTYIQITEGIFHEGNLKGDMIFDELITDIAFETKSTYWYFARFGFEIRHGAYHRPIGETGLDSLTIHIKGTVTNGKLNGEAEIILSNGDYYKGIFKNGEFKEGTARITYSNRSVYEGDMKNGKYEGQGKLTYSNGNSDEGTFMYGTCIDGAHKDKRGKVLWKIR